MKSKPINLKKAWKKFLSEQERKHGRKNAERTKQKSLLADIS